MTVRGAHRAAGLCAALAVSFLPVAAFAGGDRAPDSGHLRGVVTKIDYSRGTMQVRDGRGRRTNVQVMSSTTITSGDHDTDDYHAISDIHVGSHIEADINRRGDTVNAQTIQIFGR